VVLDEVMLNSRRIKRRTLLHWMAASLTGAILPARAEGKSIRVGVPTATQLTSGRDCIDSVRLAIDEINARGGVLDRALEMVSIDESGSAEAAISAIRKLTTEDKVDVIIGGHSSAATLAQLPYIAQARTIYISVAGASPAITQRVAKEYDKYRYVFRASPLNAAHQAQALADFISGYVIGEVGAQRLAFVGENAKWVQELVPILTRAAAAGGADVRMAEIFDSQTKDFGAVLAKVRDSGAQFLVLIVSQAASDMLVEQWYDAKMPFALGGIDVKSMDADFYRSVNGKSISQITGNLAVPAPITPKTLSYWDTFARRTGRPAPSYTGPGAYDAVYVYAEAVRRAQSTEADAVLKELERTDYLGVTGRIRFDENHDVRAGQGLVSFPFVQWQDKGERVIVWPRELRNGRGILPPWFKR